MDEEASASSEAPASISREPLCQELSIKVVSGKHSISTRFPKDRNCDICQRTNMTRAPCRRRTGEPVLRADKFGDLITTDRKVLNEGSESRNSHRYAVCRIWPLNDGYNLTRAKPKFLRKHKSLLKFLEPTAKPKVSLKLTFPWSLAKACGELFWSHRTSAPHRSETNGIVEKASRRIKE